MTKAEAARRSLEQRLGHEFRDHDLFERALTHPSAVSQHGQAGKRASYQRLEFLGDRVLGLVIADMLSRAFPDADEGGLHRRHASLVRKQACAEVGAELGLGEALILDEGEDNAGGRTKTTILGDACEAVIGAIYRDGGLDPARSLIERYWGPRMESENRPRRDAKSTLQEWAQAKGLEVPRYELQRELGPAHAPRFMMSATIEGFDAAIGEGPSKREAEQDAATAFLVREMVWEDDR